MDTLENVAEVTSALADFKVSVNALGQLIEGGDTTLATNKAEVKSAWNSDNSALFDAQYQQLIGYITEAYNSLVSYQAKIQNVVNQFQGFDTTIENS